MSEWSDLEQRLQGALRLTRRPVAVAYRDAVPDGVARFAGSEPSSCSFWRLADEGRVFATVPADHYNCPIGSYTQNTPLPAERAAELDQVLGLMTEIGYVRMEEVPGIPRVPTPPGAIVYAPLGETPVAPDVVLFVGRPGRLMLLQEAAMRAGVAAALPLLGRPTCMALPAALTSGVIVSAGCVGNRVYTDVGEDELYAVVPGKDLARLADALDEIAAANATLADYHQQRRQQLASE
ncbi:MAG TPA: DUF169 domain-containing protein [Chloroflexota bacterium]|nr:DUF169 domain-containing protein [Chloroflexota bacterium]